SIPTRERKCLFILIHDDLAAGLFFSLGLLGRHGFVHPLVGRLQIGVVGFRVIALDIGAFPVHQVHVGHSIVVIRTKLERLVQVIDTFLNVGRILLPHHGTNLLVLGGQRLLGLHAELGALFLTGHVGLCPVNYGDRVIRLGVVRIETGRLLVVVLGLGELLHLQVEIGDALNTVDIPGIGCQHLLVLVDRLLAKAVVVWSIDAR